MSILKVGDIKHESFTGTTQLKLDSAGRLLLGTTTEGHDNADDLTIATSGQTGITIRSASNQAGNIYFSDATSGSGESDGYISYTQSTNKMFFGVNQNLRMTIGAAGDVGIGTSTPAEKLDVIGNIKFGANSNGLIAEDGVQVVFKANIAGREAHIMTHDGNEDINLNPDGYIQFETAGSERMRIDSSGKVGMGETSMDALLVIKGASDAATTPSIRLKDGSDTREAWITNASGDLILVSGDDDNTPHCIINLLHNNLMTFSTANTERMRISSDGKVGIGTTSPQGGLHVQTGTITELNLWSSAGFGRSKFNLRARDTGSSIGLFQLTTESTVPSVSELMTIRNSGDVMFGTENNDSGGQAIGNNFGFVYQQSGHAIVRSGSTSVSGASGIAYTAKFVDTGTSKAFRVMLAQTEMGSISVGAGGTSFNTSSDYRRKENVVELTDAITRLKTLLPKRFNFIDEPSVTRDGFLAHEVTAVPEAVYGTKDAVEPEDNESSGAKKGDPIYQQLDQSKLVPLLVAALQEAIGRIEALEAK